MNLSETLVARTRADVFPPALAALPSIGTHMRPNLELIVGMGPDLVLQMGGRNESVQAVYDLERLGITTAYFKVSNFADLFAVVEKIGVLTGAQAEAARLVDELSWRLERVRMAVMMNPDRPSVFFEVRSPNLLSVGSSSMVTDIIEKAGGSNCIRGNGKLIRINEEEVLRLSPDVYLIQRGPMNPAPLPMDSRPRLKTLNCVITGQVHVVDEQVFSRPGPRNIDAVEQLAAILHPDLGDEPLGIQ